MTQHLRSRVLEVTEMALKLNGTMTKREITGDKPTVFVDYSGHTAGLTITIYSNGWDRKSPYNTPDKVWCIYLDKSVHSEEQAHMQLDEVKQYLTELLEEWGGT